MSPHQREGNDLVTALPWSTTTVLSISACLVAAPRSSRAVARVPQGKRSAPPLCQRPCSGPVCQGDVGDVDEVPDAGAVRRRAVFAVDLRRLTGIQLSEDEG